MPGCRRQVIGENLKHSTQSIQFIESFRIDKLGDDIFCKKGLSL